MSAAAVATAVRRKPPAAVRRRRFLVAVADHSLLIAAAALFLAPVVFILLTALMTNGQALSPRLWPQPFQWSNFTEVFHQAPLWRWALNSFMYSTLATLGLLLSSIPVAYAFSRLRWRGRDAVFLIVLVALMLPPQVTVVPLYVMWAKLDLVGSLWPLIIPNWFGDAFAIFLLRQFFLTIPQEYIDAARVDGCGEVRILATVVLRLAKPAIAAVALFSVLLHLERLLPAAAVPLRQSGQLGSLDRAVAVPLAAPGAVEPRDGRDAARDAARDRPLLPRPEGVRRGRHPHGGEGMKIAVVGGGSTYTPELVSGLSRERDRIDVRELVLHDIDAERREVVGGMAERMLARQGFEGSLLGHRRPRSRGRRRRLRADPDPRRRAGGAALRRDRCRSPAAASARRRPAPAASARRCERCRSCSRSPSACASGRRRAPGSWTSPTRSGS